MVVYVTLTVPDVILIESFLSFLGLGIQEPLTSWGVLISDGANMMESAPWMLIFPGAVHGGDLVLLQLHRRRPARRAGSQGLLTVALLEIRDLDVHFATQDGDVHAVKRVSLDIEEGTCLGVVGESGSGKSQLFLAAMGLLAANGRASGSVRYRGAGIAGPGAAAAQPIPRLQDHHDLPGSAHLADPAHDGGRADHRSPDLHQKMPREEARRRVREMLDYVRIPESARRMKQYPHELSGGMRQRVMIAMATIAGPDLVIADEPTTALDVTVQAQILEILRALKIDKSTALALISHDMGVIAGSADQVQVMRDGEVVERGAVDDIFYAPRQDYTKMLLAAMPRLDRCAEPRRHARRAPAEGRRCQSHVSGDGRRLLRPQARLLRAVDGVSLHAARRRDPGRGGRKRLRQVHPGAGGAATAPARQRPGGVAGPRSDARAAGRNSPRPQGFPDRLPGSLGQPGSAHAGGRLDRRAAAGAGTGSCRATRSAPAWRAMMEKVGLDPRWINRYPHELSGGQNQRVGIARAMIVRPKMVVCDEAVSALDVSIQAQIVDLIKSLQAETGMALIFISHDLSVVRQLSHRVMVLYLGRVVETGGFRRPLWRSPPSLYPRPAVGGADARSETGARPQAHLAHRRPALAAGQPRPARLPEIQAPR